MFFFFKQKTAYEMRISDWSSDVCSSDLDMQIGGKPVAVLGQQVSDACDNTAVQFRRRIAAGGMHPHDMIEQCPRRRLAALDQPVARQEDRKSVVSGKRVSVRVDLGGRRIIKKQQKKEQK